jgi:hypothetical protein
MEISKISLSNIQISAVPPQCVMPSFPGNATYTFVNGLEFYTEYVVDNATSGSISGLPNGVSYSTVVESTSLRYIITGVPNSTLQSYTINITANNAGDYCFAAAANSNISTGTVGGIVTSNLRQYIDVANVVSYPGWGNTIYDLSGNSLHYYTIDAASSNARANATVDTTNGGVMVFDGSNIGAIYATTNDGSNNNPIAASGDANWTLESWFKLAAQPVAGNKLSLIGERRGAGGGDIHHYLTFEKTDSTGSGNAIAGGTYNTAVYYITPNYAVYPGQYYHAAVTTANGNVRRLYINGTEVANLTSASKTNASNLDTIIGADVTASTPTANGIMKGSVAIARYYKKTLSTSEVLQNYNAEKGRFVGGSLQFNGADSVLSATANTDWASNTGDYTLQFWASTNTAANVYTPQPVWDSTALKVFFENNTSNANLKYLTVVSGNTRIVSANIVNWTSGWQNFAVTRTSNVIRVFQSGMMKAYVSDTSNANANATLYIGNADITTAMTFNNTAANGSYYWNGGLTNIQWVKGQSLYNSNVSYTLPTSPVAPTINANVKVLLKATDSYVTITDSSPRQTAFTAANVSFSTDSPLTAPLYFSFLKQARFDYTGAIQTWTVPANVSTIQVAATGARGGGGTSGGNGCAAATTLSVTEGQTLYVVVGGYSNTATAAYGFGGNGGTGANANGFAGGGLSGVFTTSTPSIANALFVAGGGGAGANGGNGGSAGVSSPGTGASGAGLGGGGATTSAAGLAGNSTLSNVAAPTAGSGIQAGSGGSRAGANSWGGGGGGAGYYAAGGGGAGNATANSRAGAGGGGATWSSNTVTYIAPFNLNGNGVVIINYSSHA